MATSTAENYLKAIHGLSQGAAGGRVSTGDLADRLGVTPGTATTMMKHLAEQGLVGYRPRAGVKLSRAGQAVALDVLRRHRLVELFLVEVMNLDWADVHAEAEALEHVVSERMLERMDEMLGRPTHDPHGDPIPTSEGEMPVRSMTALAEVSEGRYRLERIVGDDPAFLTWLTDRGLLPGVLVTVRGRDGFAGTLTVGVEGGDALSLGLTAAARLMVGDEVL
ncbi:metal-dependent transcriptional regulator [Mucisphaera sp.]|uniref:metal-dependent transcriptional regulator n=1 Tax=Mucisphaera sp. TaxID=2913024 RepID=UPI003D12F665